MDIRRIEKRQHLLCYEVKGILGSYNRLRPERIRHIEEVDLFRKFSVFAKGFQILR